MRNLSRRAILKGLSAAPMGAQLIADDLKMRMAGVGPGLTPLAPVAASTSGQLTFTNFASWFREIGKDSIREEAKGVTVLDPDIVEMCSPSLGGKIRMQERRNYERILAARRGWFDRELSLNRVVKVWR